MDGAMTLRRLMQAIPSDRVGHERDEPKPAGWSESLDGVSVLIRRPKVATKS
jgi:hypothetical protein